MATFGRNTTEKAIDPALHECWVNGEREPELYCSEVSVSANSAGCTATFTMPEMLFDASVDYLQDAEVIVYQTQDFQGNAINTIVFQGFLSTAGAHCNEGSSDKTFSASSILSYLSKHVVGDNKNLAEVNYYDYDPQTKLQTAWTPKRVLNDVFNTYMGDGFKAYVKLGATSLLSDSRDDMPPNGFSFKNANFTSCLDQILAKCGDISYFEQFNGISGNGHVMLNFYQTSAPTNATISVQVGDKYSGLPWITDLSNTVQAQDAVTRVKAKGKTRCMISATTWPRREDTELIADGWDNTEITVTINGVDITDTPENLILQNPDRFKQGSEEFIPECEFALRRFLLPTAVHGRTICKDNALKGKSRPGAPAESTLDSRKGASKAPFVLGVHFDGAYDPTQPEFDRVYTVPENAYDQVTGVETKFDEPVPYLLFHDPVIMPVTTKKNPDGSRNTVFARRDFGVTFTFEHDPMFHDTDVTGDMRHPLIASDGFSNPIENKEYFFDVLTTNGNQPSNGGTIALSLKNADGETVNFDCFYPDDEEGIVYLDSQTVIRNDYNKLRTLANNIVREKNKHDRTFEVEIPWVAVGYRVGMNLSIVGMSNYYPDTYMITHTQYNFDQNTTHVTASNSKPKYKVQA